MQIKQTASAERSIEKKSAVTKKENGPGIASPSAIGKEQATTGACHPTRLRHASLELAYNRMAVHASQWLRHFP